MSEKKEDTWKKKLVSYEKVLSKIEPGMSIFLGTGVAEPRTLVKKIMVSTEGNIQDLELIQLVSFGDAVSLDALSSHKFRLKTFFGGWVVSDAIISGQVDLIPSRFSRIPQLVRSGEVPIDAAFVLITPPDERGYSSIGVSVDIARTAMEQSSIVVGEICKNLPFTMGDTLVNVNDFDYMVEGTEAPICFPRWKVDETFDKIASNVASMINDGSCLCFSLGPLFEALGKHLTQKKNLGFHSPFFTDPMMDLVNSGAVTNRAKSNFKGRSVASYALGTEELMRWVDKNPLVEFQPVEKVFSPEIIGRNQRFITIMPVRKVDLTGRVSLHIGKGNVAAGPGEAMDFVNGSELSKGGHTIFALPSRNLKGESNILLSVEEYPNEFSNRELIDMVITEYGVAVLRGRTIRERAQALIEIAHPDDREKLVEIAKENHILYADQIFLSESGRLYPDSVASSHVFKDDLNVRFRAIKPSDEEQMRRLFYRFSDKAVYYRYFSPIKTMPHSKMQEYVNVDYRRSMSLVGLVGEATEGKLIAEGRYVISSLSNYADIAFVVDEKYQGKGIGSYLFHRLMQLACQRGVIGFMADVLASNKAMMKVFERSGLSITARLSSGVYELKMAFSETANGRCKGVTYVRD